MSDTIKIKINIWKSLMLTVLVLHQLTYIRSFKKKKKKLLMVAF